MSNLMLLVKTNLRNTLGLNQLAKGKDKKKGLKYLVAGGGAIFTLLMIGVLVTIYFSLMAQGLKQAGMLNLLLIIASATCIIVCLFTSIYKAQGILFGSKDLQQLMSLPIKFSDILASKVIELLVLNYLFVAVVILPTTIVYFINTVTSPIIFIYAVIGIIFIPLLPIVIASIIGFIISYISSRTRKKSLALNLITLVFVCIVVTASFKMNDIINYVLARSNSIVGAVKTLCPPVYYYADALETLSIISLIKLILWSLVPFVVFIIVFSKSFKKITSRLNESYKKSNYKFKELNTSSVSKTLFKKEIRRYISSTPYLTNTAIGAILSVIAAVAAVVVGADGLVAGLMESKQADMSEAIPMIKNMMQFVPIAIISFTISLSCTTAVSVSLEGTNMWILKSLPVDIKQIAKGKIYVNLLVTIPAIIVDTILFTIAFKLTPINILFTLMIPVLLTIYVSIAGFVINLHIPKLIWVNETQIVKQSMSAFFGMFNGFFVIAASLGLSILIYKLFSIMNIYVYLSGISILIVILIAISLTILNRKGEKLYNKIGC